MTRSRRLLRAPGLHFVVLGGLLFVAHRLLVPPSTGLPVAQAVESQAPSDDEILFRDALAMGLDRNDPLVRARLAQLGELVAAGETEDPEAFEEEARRLGLDRSDVVVRRHLVHAMQLAMSHVGPSDWPTEQDVKAYFEAHRDDYRQPARYRFHHAFFARDRRGEAAPSAASDALARLREAGDASIGESTVGDSFLLGSDLNLSQPELARTLGADFAAALERAPTGRWLGPITSVYGSHLVWLSERVPASVPPLESVRSRVVHAVLAERARQRLEQGLQRRRAAYAR